jgi:hypothetical protein
LPSHEGKKEGRGASCRFVEALEEHHNLILCIWRVEGGLGSLEQLRNTCWGDSGIIQVLFEFCGIFVDVLQLFE